MESNKKTSFIIITGIVIIIIFGVVIAANLLPNHESNSYFVKVGDDMSAKIESINIVDGKLYIETSGDPIEFCVKTTRTKPSKNAVCWNKVENNTATISIFEYKKYYIWIKDEEGNISNYLSINAKANDKEN